MVYLFCIQISLGKNSDSRCNTKIQVSHNLRVQNMFSDNINSNKKASDSLWFSSTVDII